MAYLSISFLPIYLTVIVLIILFKIVRATTTNKKETYHLENNIAKKVYPKYDYEKLIKNEDDFWELIEFSIENSNGSKGKQVSILESILNDKTDEELLTYGKIYSCLYWKSATEQLWAIIYSLNGGCGDDSFDYYRSWLISEGKEKFYNLLGNPENLIDNYTHSHEMIGFNEEFTYIYDEVSEKRNKVEYFENPYENHDNSCVVIEPEVEFEWEEDLVAVKNSFPKFYEKFVGDE